MQLSFFDGEWEFGPGHPYLSHNTQGKVCADLISVPETVTVVLNSEQL